MDDRLDILSIDQIAAYFGVSRRTVYSWKADGRLPANIWLVLPNGRAGIVRSVLEEFVGRFQEKPSESIKTA